MVQKAHISQSFLTKIKITNCYPQTSWYLTSSSQHFSNATKTLSYIYIRANYWSLGIFLAKKCPQKLFFSSSSSFHYSFRCLFQKQNGTILWKAEATVSTWYIFRFRFRFILCYTLMCHASFGSCLNDTQRSQTRTNVNVICPCDAKNKTESWLIIKLFFSYEIFISWLFIKYVVK